MAVLSYDGHYGKVNVYYRMKMMISNALLGQNLTNEIRSLMFDSNTKVHNWSRLRCKQRMIDGYFIVM